MVYNCTFIHSEEFRIYSKKDNEKDKSTKTEPEILMSISRNRTLDKPIKQTENVEIDYKNLTGIESAILSELVNFIKHTYKSIIEALKPTYSQDDIILTLDDMETKGWIA